ncbi:ABC transporter permease subunit [uncultured Ferrovibrio sp.]|jgi:ABC-2 type transport system permease protein|uniref:ABC transporter permease subunit n=1 Tax=uncultured Ferrovibrio sp. TaxID=1576913 RepID=UPI00261DF7DB|nr:ABC transporter permease subunit [uncultured Ferrovibrio sp.]
MKPMLAVLRRELSGYFATPVAYVFIVVFLFTAGIFTFYLGQFFERGQADLKAFFLFHPWLYLFFLPAIAMRLWAEERKSGTIELLLTLPIPLWAAVLGKFVAAWVFAGIALALTFPLWITVNWLGTPDNGVILAGYVGSFLMAGAYLAIGSCISALTRNQVIAFVISVLICFIFTVSGAPMVLNFFQGWAPGLIVDTIASFSFLGHFNAITDGVIDLRDVIFFLSLIVVWLYANAVVVDFKKAG